MARLAALRRSNGCCFRLGPSLLFAFGKKSWSCQHLQQSPHTDDRLYRSTEREICRGFSTWIPVMGDDRRYHFREQIQWVTGEKHSGEMSWNRCHMGRLRLLKRLQHPTWAPPLHWRPAQNPAHGFSGRWWSEGSSTRNMLDLQGAWRATADAWERNG